jgi:putative tryptophan/tyrosine transport system substrate-binding protein
MRRRFFILPRASGEGGPSCEARWWKGRGLQRCSFVDNEAMVQPPPPPCFAWSPSPATLSLRGGGERLRIPRRDFIAVLGGAAAAWPLAARAQQPKMPVIGFLSSPSSSYIASQMPSFRQGLKETGYIEGQNVAIEYRSAEGQYDRLSGLAADLVDRRVAVIVAAGGTDPAKAAKAATAAIPIVFISGADPIEAGIVTSLNRPDGNVTGVSVIGSVLEAKRLGLLNDIAPGTASIGVLSNPGFPAADLELRQVQEAASAIKRQIKVARASTAVQIDTAFATLAQQDVGALLVSADPFFVSRKEQLVASAARYRLPAIYANRQFAEAGGLVTYAADFADGYRQAGIYVGKILNGTKPSDLPVMQSTKFELVLNLKTAKTLGLAIPPGVLAIADEVIE